MGRIFRKPVAASAGGLSAVYLKSDPGQSFAPEDRVVGDAGNYRTVGPILAATAGDRIFSRVRIPLRSSATAAGSPSLGKTLTLTIINVTNPQNQLVLRRHSVTITQGMTEAVFSGPFVIPAGALHAYVYGVDEDGWSTHLGLFYGTSSSYAAPYAQIMALFNDAVTPGVGSPYSASISGRSRAIICEADAVVKNVHGPLDASDVPVAASVDQLQPGQAAIVDNGTDPPQWQRRRLNGSTVTVGAQAAPSGGGSAAPLVFGRVGKRVTQTLTQHAWTRVTFYGAGPDLANGAFVDSTFTCGVAGVYVVSVSLEVFNGSSTTGYFSAVVRKGDTPVLKIADEYLPANLPGIRELSMPLRLTAGDVLEVWATTDTANVRISASSISDPSSFAVLGVGA